MASIKFFAAALVIAAPLALAQANANESEVTLDLNGEVHTFTLADFEDGDVRSLQEGDHTITVTRDGDHLRISKDGETLGGDINIDAILEEHGIEKADGAHEVRKAVFISSDGEQTDLDIEALAGDIEWEEVDGESGTKKVVVVKRTESEEGDTVEVSKDVKVVVIKKDVDE